LDFSEQEFRMKPFIIIYFVAAAGLFAAVIGIPRSHSISAIGRAATVGSSGLQQLQSSRSANKLPVEDVDDRSLVFPRESKR
jgi:hypothetical protein